MNNSQIQQLRDGATLVRSLEKLLRTLIRLLVGRLSLARLQELLQTTYVQEAEERLKRELPGKKVTLSRLALTTGVSTRLLSQLIKSERYALSLSRNGTFLTDMTPETRILSLWMSDPRFFDFGAGRPMTLGLGRGVRSFPELVSRAIGTRGLTVHSILQRLEGAGSISVNQEKKTGQPDSQYVLPLPVQR
jgi:hypothetical protein